MSLFVAASRISGKNHVLRNGRCSHNHIKRLIPTNTDSESSWIDGDKLSEAQGCEGSLGDREGQEE